MFDTISIIFFSSGYYLMISLTREACFVCKVFLFVALLSGIGVVNFFQFQALSCEHVLEADINDCTNHVSNLKSFGINQSLLPLVVFIGSLGFFMDQSATGIWFLAIALLFATFYLLFFQWQMKTWMKDRIQN